MQNVFLRYRVLAGERKGGKVSPKPIENKDMATYIEKYTEIIKELGIDNIISDPKIRKEFFKRLSEKPVGEKTLAKFLLEGGTINNLNIKEIKSLNPVQRQNTAKAIRGDENEEQRIPDILAVQEIENMAALKEFNKDYLDGHYKYMYLVDAGSQGCRYSRSQIQT
jgi:hypothetical protein